MYTHKNVQSEKELSSVGEYVWSNLSTHTLFKYEEIVWQYLLKLNFHKFYNSANSVLHTYLKNKTKSPQFKI